MRRFFTVGMLPIAIGVAGIYVVVSILIAIFLFIFGDKPDRHIRLALMLLWYLIMELVGVLIALILWVETMSSNEEVAAAVEAAKATGLPPCCTMTFDTASRSMMGVTPADFASYAAAQSVDFIGANCGIGPAELLH